MDPPRAHTTRDLYDGSRRVHYNPERSCERPVKKADVVLSPNRPTSSRKPDDIERRDLEEEKSVLNSYPGYIAYRNRKYIYKSSVPSSFGGASIDERATDHSKPGCSKDTADGSNATNKNMMTIRTYPVYEMEDFMQKLYRYSYVEGKKNYPTWKLYKAEAMEGVGVDVLDISDISTTSSTFSNSRSSSESTNEFSVTSTSNPDKLVGLDYRSKKNAPGNSKSSIKRRYEPPPPQAAKRFCPDGSFVGNFGPELWGRGSGVQSGSSQGPPEIKKWLNLFSSWTNSDKTQAIDALINRCTSGQVRHMMKTVEPLLQRDFITFLPKELALKVLGYLQPKDLLCSAQTCRYWRSLADDNLLWKEKCRRIGIKTIKKMPRSMPRSASPWKAVYMRQYLIENNWMHKPVNKPIMVRGHNEHVITCLQFYGNRILSGSDDTTLRVWSAVTGKCLRILAGHSGGVWSSQMVGHLVISGSTDCTLRVWNAKTGKCIKVLAGHTSTVRCMHLHGNRVASGSRDTTLRVWSIPAGHCMRVLVGHTAAVRCVRFNDKYVVSGAYDNFVKVWNPDTGECLHTLSGHTNRVYSLQFDGVHIVSGSLDTSMRVWDVKTGELKHTLTGHRSLNAGMELKSNILVSGNADSTVKVWDITTGHCLYTLDGPNMHQSAVTCLQSSNRFLVTSSDDGTVKLWDLRTGEFIRNLVELSTRGLGGVVWRIRASATKLVCAVGSLNGIEETKVLVLDFDIPEAYRLVEPRFPQGLWKQLENIREAEDCYYAGEGFALADNF